ncbi:metallophosphoesterase family protein [Aquimarina brevivitae]|uniref:Serine/threonine protein phosphatase 1 n=1 Tax=Aquimarina brevivitae TaxID=323412 RepID=A0A4Q7PFV4_9FLAO|nr:metallophosphoesterase family protein [Aquimarina brevivitae]RZS99225.1 serine/threonine protein phosphatase 1 [Aquimarina brevivitae]
MNNRTFVIGDIHGGLNALQQLLGSIDLKKTDQLIFLGDYVDGWSDSPGVISYLIDLKEKYDCIFIRGNHDALCHNWLIQDTYNPEWIQHGGQVTMDAYADLSKDEINAHIYFFEKLTNYHIDDQNRLYLHAGFTNLHGPQREYFESLFYWDRTLWETALAVDPTLTKEDPKFPKRLQLFSEIYIGHTPVTRIEKTTPVNAACVWNIDTGAAFKGPLTALEVNSKKYWQSDPVYTLYPEENGRN